MAVDIILNIDGIKGDSQIDGHKDEIYVDSWSWGAHNAATFHYGTGGGSGRVEVQDLTISKWVDKASPGLVQSVSEGRHIKKARLTIRKSGGKKPVEFLIIDMNDIFITSYHTGSGHSDDRLTENFTINFREYKVKFTEQKADGSPGAQHEAGWNIAENKAV